MIGSLDLLCLSNLYMPQHLSQQREKNILQGGVL